VPPKLKYVHLKESVFGINCLESRLPIISTVPVRLRGGRITAYENAPDYYELYSRLLLQQVAASASSGNSGSSDSSRRSSSNERNDNDLVNDSPHYYYSINPPADARNGKLFIASCCYLL
jgi:hypothetical protein